MVHYLDNAATTPVRPEAIQAAVEAMGEGCDKIKYLSVAPMFAEAIERIYQEISIAKLFN